MLPFLEMGLSDCGHAADGRAAMVAPERAVFRTSRREKLDMCLVSVARVRTKGTVCNRLHDSSRDGLLPFGTRCSHTRSGRRLAACKEARSAMVGGSGQNAR